MEVVLPLAHTSAIGALAILLVGVPGQGNHFGIAAGVDPVDIETPCCLIEHRRHIEVEVEVVFIHVFDDAEQVFAELDHQPGERLPPPESIDVLIEGICIHGCPLEGVADDAGQERDAVATKFALSGRIVGLTGALCGDATGFDRRNAVEQLRLRRERHMPTGVRQTGTLLSYASDAGPARLSLSGLTAVRTQMQTLTWHGVLLSNVGTFRRTSAENLQDAKHL